MSLPNATAILSTLPNVLRVTVKRGGTVASLAVRTAINEAGQMSLGGLERFARTNIWTLVADFSPRVQAGDVLTVGTVPAIVVETMQTCGYLVNRATSVLCEDTVTIGDYSLACHLGLLTQDSGFELAGLSPDDTQGFFLPESIIPEGVEIAPGVPVTLSGEALHVDKISRDPRHGILCVTCHRRGDA